MTQVYTLKTLPKDIKNPVVTIGNFDGVHKGHQTLFKKVIERASDIGGTSLVITFDPHPIKVMSPGRLKLLITGKEQKQELLADFEIDILLLIQFTLEFASISAEDFVKDILIDRLGVQEVVVGYDYAFGHNRKGNIEVLKEMGQKFHFTVHQVGPVYLGEKVVSSTSIRNLIMQGKISEANDLLGREYQIRGKVIKGKSRGEALLGYATANLQPADGLSPKRGVYIVTVEIEDTVYQGLTSVGYNPTFKDEDLSIETHILGLSQNIVGRHIKINFLSRLRDEIAFSSPEELSQQISSDIKTAQEFFTKWTPPAART
ncbi:MAG: bifunctional riboflavin kinase/FAD synthetase [Thermodesulfobacteriota bacterium]